MNIPNYYEPFDPDTASMLGRTFNSAWSALDEAGMGLLPAERVNHLRNTLARRIIQMAQQGVRDSAALRKDAVLYTAQQVQPRRKTSA
jgi:hypothetical protein